MAGSRRPIRSLQHGDDHEVVTPAGRARSARPPGEPGRRPAGGPCRSVRPASAPAPRAHRPPPFCTGRARTPFGSPASAVDLQLGQDPLPGAVRRPATMTLIDRLSGPVPLGQVRPRNSSAGLVQHSVDHRAVIRPLPAGAAVHRQQRPDLPPLRVGQFMSPHHTAHLPNPNADPPHPARAIRNDLALAGRPQADVDGVAVVHGVVDPQSRWRGGTRSSKPDPRCSGART